MKNKLLFTNIAKLLNYPREEYSIYCRTALTELIRIKNEEGKSQYDNTISKMEIFISEIATKTQGEREEIFTQTFDVNPIGNLEVGWHLFGEQYERGAFLVECREQLRKHNIEESSELPDHLSHLLILVSLMEVDEARNFTLNKMLPALEKILSKLVEKENLFSNLLSAIKEILITELEIGVENHV